ncbi:MAG: 50S ribosomal protein L21 [Candidatus Brocadiae bacterium]|nr:50S ribosomal protein L21 [Candidatus Brocadiia bacterium]
MYAIIRLGNHQFRVEKGEVFAVDRIPGKVGGSVDVTDVLFTANGADIRIGTPTVKGAKVVVDVLKEQKGPKIRFTKFDRTDTYRRKLGHRQPQTLLKVKDIVC